MGILANFKNHATTTIIGTILAILIAFVSLNTNPDVSSVIPAGVFHAVSWVISIATFLGFGVAKDPKSNT
jgi:hypothetical protein